MRVPANRIQFPIRMKMAAVMIARRGPPVCSVQIVAGEAATKAKRNPVESQLMMLGFVE